MLYRLLTDDRSLAYGLIVARCNLVCGDKLNISYYKPIKSRFLPQAQSYQVKYCHINLFLVHRFIRSIMYCNFEKGNNPTF